MGISTAAEHKRESALNRFLLIGAGRETPPTRSVAISAATVSIPTFSGVSSWLSKSGIRDVLEFYSRISQIDDDF